MGLAMGRLLGWKQEAQILLLGLCYAGKTAILQKLKTGHGVTTEVTSGYNLETLEYNDISFTVIDLGGQCNYRLGPGLRHYLHTQGVIFVIDSSDRERIPEAKNLLNMILNEGQLSVTDTALLVFATKQDCPEAMSAEEIAEDFGLQSLLCNRRWHIQSSSAISGEGLHEGMDWLCNNIKSYHRSSIAVCGG